MSLLRLGMKLVSLIVKTLFLNKSSAILPGSACGSNFNPNGGCSDICSRNKKNPNLVDCSCPEGKLLVDKYNCGKFLFESLIESDADDCYL